MAAENSSAAGRITYPSRADGLGQLPFLLSDARAAAHELDVRRADICDDAHVRFCDGCQGRDLTRMIHADFQHDNFVGRTRPEKGLRNADVIIQISLPS